MFVGHKIRTDEEMKALIRIGVRAREKRKKHKQNQVDARWILDIREWKYPETNKKDNNNKGI
tara:strand:+ start:30 stop:215 length:186 start_codon:yes stop_codon:yes gene_type:complete